MSRVVVTVYKFNTLPLYKKECFFHSPPVPELWERFFPIPFTFPNFGIEIIHSRLRTPKSHSRSPL